MLLGISGSLRRASLNTAALDAAARLAPDDVALVRFQRLADLPLYNFDDDGEAPPAAVREFRHLVARADGVVIASPEYAHGIAGPMKNALDWLVGDTHVPGKRVALWNTSPRATIGQAHLREVLTTMAARIVEDASLALPLLGAAWTPATIASTSELADKIRSSLSIFARACADSAANARAPGG